MGPWCFKLEINVTLAQTLNMAQAMHLALDGLLAGFPILRTEDLSEAREVVGRAFCDHRLDIRQGTRLAVQHDHIGGAELSLNALGYGAEVSIDPEGWKISICCSFRCGGRHGSRIVVRWSRPARRWRRS